MLAALVLGALAQTAAMDLSLRPSFNPPGLVGQVVNFRAEATGVADSGSLRYRFRVREGSGAYRIVRDYAPLPSLDWTAASHEGLFEIEVSARNPATGETATASQIFPMNSRVSGDRAVVSPTANPQLFLFSAPACKAGQRVRVEFGADGATTFRTPYQACQSGLSVNFYLAGIRAQTSYAARAVVDTGAALQVGPSIPFRSGAAPTLRYEVKLETDASAMDAASAEPVVLTSNGIATDLAGATLWTIPMIVNNITRVESGGYFWGIASNPNGGPESQFLRKLDLAGMIVAETNAERVNQQLQALGKRRITAFHHEARSLPGGRILALASVEEVVTDRQGPGPVDVVGDMILVLDAELHVVWTWDSFDWLDVGRKAVLEETCSPAASGCPPFYLAKIANDWTHGNSLQLTADGNLLFSARHQDWLIKIHYDKGAGDGHIIWRLGRDGDFTFDGAGDEWPWFSHQHDGNFDRANPSLLLVVDNGNTRWQETGDAYSRGQVLRVDEANRTVAFELNANLGVFSPAVGSAQRLNNGNFHFDTGYVIQPDNTLAGYSIEVDRAGQIAYVLKTGTLVYRSFRLVDLYTSPDE